MRRRDSGYPQSIVSAALFFVLVVGFSGFESDGYSSQVLTDYTFYEDFEDGSVGPWASYPPSQDTACDPSIRVLLLLSEKGVKNRALYREITPNYDVDYEFGARKHIGMYVTDASVLTFKCSIKSHRGTKGVRVRFGFGDGSMAELLVPFADILTRLSCAAPCRSMR
jgi:hypothetical protein